MNVNVGIWDKLSRVVIFLLFVSGLLLVFFWYLPLIQQNQRYRKHILHLEAQLQEQERLARQLKLTSDALQKDPRRIETLARERLGYARSNETVIRFESQPTPRSQP
jgi:cell division protein FtsB